MKKLFYIGAMSALLLTACAGEKANVTDNAQEESDKAKEKEAEQAKKEAEKKAKEEEKKAEQEAKEAKKEEKRQAKEAEKKAEEEAKLKEEQAEKEKEAKENAEKEAKEKAKAEAKAKSKEEAKATTDPKKDIEKMVEKIISTDLKKTKINELSVYNYQAEESQYIVLPHLKWEVKNSKKTTVELLEMYSDNIAAKLAEEKGIHEITVFWEVPYHLEGKNIAKFNYKRAPNGMAKTDKWLAPVLQ